MKYTENLNVADMIEDVQGLFPGDLRYYFKTIFFKANNLYNPYHNFRHMFHVAWLCYDACNFYKEKLSARERRNLMIAALFHDFNYDAKIRLDAQEIAIAVKNLKKFVHKDDKKEVDDISQLIKATQYPHDKKTSYNLSVQILRDADLAQVFSTSWLQQIIFGLGKEKHVTQYDMLLGQINFIKGLKFGTEWAKRRFSREVMNEKITEVERMIKLLN